MDEFEALTPYPSRQDFMNKHKDRTDNYHKWPHGTNYFNAGEWARSASNSRILKSGFPASEIDMIGAGDDRKISGV